MTLGQFHNALRILHSIDSLAVAAAAAQCDPGASLTLDGAWESFDADPVRFMLRCDEQSAQAIWAIIELRKPKPPIEPKPAALAPADDAAFRRAYAESDGDHRAYVEHHAKRDGDDKTIFHHPV